MNPRNPRFLMIARMLIYGEFTHDFDTDVCSIQSFVLVSLVQRYIFPSTSRVTIWSKIFELRDSGTILFCLRLQCWIIYLHI